MMPLDVTFIGTAVMAMLKTIPLTLAMTFFPILFGFIIAIGMTLIRMYHVRFLEPIAKFYVSFFRSTPAILHIMLIYLGIPLLVDFLSKSFGLGISANKIPVVIFVIIALSFTAGAYLTEILRSGIIAVDIGQMEAAYSVGYTHGQAIRKVLLPQAFMIGPTEFHEFVHRIFTYHIHRCHRCSPRNHWNGNNSSFRQLRVSRSIYRCRTHLLVFNYFD